MKTKQKSIGKQLEEFTSKNRPTHTPGPWFAEGDHVYTKQLAYHVAEMPKKGSFTKQPAERAANAALIAAAPEMFEALEQLTEYLNDRDLPESVEIFVNEALAAIRKAKGETV